jgi:uncharacterized protein (DUF2147 family)
MKLRPTIAIAVTLFACAASPPAMSATDPHSCDDAEPLAMKYPPESILGEWYTQKEESRPRGRVKFVRGQDGTYLGILDWSAEPTRKDVHNKDPKLRDRSVVGLVIMWHLRYDDGEYVDGYVYNPEDGGTYRMKAEVMSDASLKVRGYLGISLFGQNQFWSRSE